jgi:amino acid adenylation domain-containing protein
MSKLTNEIANLSHRERALLEARLREKRKGAPRPGIAPRLRASGSAPLSFAQQRLWLANQTNPNTSAYNISEGIRLSGDLDVAALERALNEIVRRHESLRTAFRVVDEQPVQVVAAAVVLDLPLTDLSQLPPEQREAEMRRLAATEAHHLFDLTRVPLLRARLLRVAAGEYALLLTLHHIISDGWSIGILLREMQTLYAAFSRGESSSPLPALPIQYGDFALWQRERMQGQALETQLLYWKRQLEDAPPLLALPSDRPRPAVQNFRGARRTLQLSAELSRSLEQLSRREGVTLYMTLLAIFQTLLARYTGQEDILTGTPIAGRNRAEIEGLIGFFVNMLVLRTDCSGNPSFRELLKRVRATTLAAYSHQDLPFEKLVEELRPERSLSYSPLFQVTFTLNNEPAELPGLPGIELAALDGGGGDTAKYDLVWSVTQTPRGLNASLVYNLDLFDAPTAESLLMRYRMLLEAVVSDPDTRLRDLPLLAVDERRRLLVELNDTRFEYERQDCAHHLFERQAARTPDHVAISFAHTQLTYRQLNERANQLARRLRSLGVGAETRVGLFLTRSPEMLVALLATLKAGGAYVPLDTSYPRPRLAFMLNDARVRVLLTARALLERLPESDAHTLCLDADGDAAAQPPPGNPESVADALNLAYIIYTSGSTGRPKGAMITHRGLVNYLNWCAREYGLAEGCGVPLHSPFGFDLTVTSILAPLAVGQRVVLLPEGEGAETLAGALDGSPDFSLVKLTPAHLDALNRRLHGDAWAGKTRAFILGGEALAGESLEVWRRRAPRTRIINEYGPTETVVGCCTYEMRAGDERAGAVPIGRPISNTQIYLLDRSWQPVPFGAVGELYVGGDGVARGYHERAALTAERFVPDAFGGAQGARLYRTGDLARYRADGELEYLGRTDSQLKVRGFRVELGEIEAALRGHAGVREAFVVAEREESGGARLLACVVREDAAERGADDAAERGADDLRAYLKERLPDYMIPATIIELDELPLTPNGKVDAQALLAHGRERRVSGETFIAPRDTVELRLAQICEDLLNKRPVGVTENFFELGGHSLLAVRLIERVQKQFAADVTLSVFLRNPTIEYLARVLGEQGKSLPWSPLVPLQTPGTKRPFFCVHPFSGNVLLFTHLARHLGAAQPFYGLQARHPADIGERHESIEEMAGQYVEALAAVQPEGPYLLGGFSFGSVVAFEMSRQLAARGQQVALLALMDGSSPLVMQEAAEQDDASVLAGIARDLARASGVELALPHEEIRRRSAADGVLYVLDELRRVNLIAEGIGMPWIQQFLRGSRLRAGAVKNYRPGTYEGAITLLRCAEIEPESAKAWRELGVDVSAPARGWDKLSDRPVDIRYVPTHHATMVHEPWVKFLAERLQTCIEEAEAGIAAK